MTAARETVQAAYLAAGRPDAFSPDQVYYVTDEQFGYVAYLQGLMAASSRPPASTWESFFAESLILAETGNSIGAIQIAGTAQPAAVAVLRRRLRLHADRRGVLRGLRVPLGRARSARAASRGRTSAS